MSQSLSRAVLASILAACTCTLSACSKSTNSTCSTAADCATGDSCTNGQCLAPGQCGTGILSCSDSAQCGSGNVCTSGCCGPVEGCASSSDCTTATRPHCDTTTHACVACAGNTECPTGRVCITSGACAPSCTSDTNCSAPTPHCVTSGDYCAECTVSSQCPAAQPICANNICTGCTSNANCAAPTPVCNTSTKGCVTCIDAQNVNGKNSACPTSAPACESGACVACNPLANSDGGTNTGSNGACSGSTPSCGGSSTCVACTNSSECANGATCNSSNTCQTISLVSFTSSASTVVSGGTATLTATLNGAVTSPVTINVAVDADSGTTGTLSAATIVIASGTTGTVTFTAASGGGSAVIDATLGSTTLSATINVSSSSTADLSSIQLVTSGATQGSPVQATVTLTAAPTADTMVAVAVDNGATIGGNASANITVSAGSDVSAPFTIQLACNAATTTATATLGSTTKTLSITPDAATAPSVASITATPNSATMGQAVMLTVTLSAAPTCGTARVSLASAIAFPTTSKYSGFIPSSILVPAGQTSASIAAVPECSNSSADLVTVVASTATAAGATPVVATTTIQITPSSGLPAGGVVLCPITPITADRASSYVQADGGLGPLPVVLAVGFADYKPAAGSYSVSLAAAFADGGSCGTFTQDGGTITGVSMTTPTKVDLSFLPTVGASGACSLYAQGMANPNDGGPIVIYDAGIVSTYNLVNYDWTQQQTPADLTLTKAEVDEDNVKIGSVFSDTTEYIEVFNGTAAQIDLSTYTLVFVGSPFDQNNGTPTAKNEYWSFALSGTLQAGAYLIAQDPGTFATPPNGATVLSWPDAGYAASLAVGLDGGSSGALRVGNIWNTPGGVFLVKNAATVNASIVDGLTWGAPMQQATSMSITGVEGGVFSWPLSPLAPNDNWIVDSSFVKPSGSLVRVGYTGSPALDWTDSTTVNPGGPNNNITGQ